MTPHGIVVQVLLVVLFATAARADFVPGRIYTTKGTPECGHGGIFGRIYEFDPLTSNWRLFADLPGFCKLGGATFTPEGKLRVAATGTSTILEFSGDGSWKVVLDQSHGLLWPEGPNGIVYDRSGNFFVMNDPGPTSFIMKYAGGGPPGTVFANQNNGVIGEGPLAVGLDGSIFYNPVVYQIPFPPNPGVVLRYAPDGTMNLFDVVSTANVGAMTVSSAGDLYVTAGEHLYRYAGADPKRKELVASLLGFGFGVEAIALSPDESTLYAVSGVIAVDLKTGNWSQIGQFPPQPFVSGWGQGLAVYVPEPSSALLFALCALAMLRGARGRMSQSENHR